MKPRTRPEYRNRRHLRLRKKVRGTSARPRLSVFVTDRHMYVQFIDDAAQRTLAAVSTLSPALRNEARKGRMSVALARRLGAAAAEVAKEKGISEAVFDRGGFRFTGRVKALADAAREGGLKF